MTDDSKSVVPANETALDTLAQDIRNEHGSVHAAAETATRHAIRCGELLVRAKEGLAHGQWLPWLKQGCELSERTAQAYMRLARKHGELDNENAQRVAGLPVREAMKAIADERADVPLAKPIGDTLPTNDTEIWAWADKQVKAPFNKFNIENPGCILGKMVDQLDMDERVAAAIGMHTDTLPMLCHLSLNELSHGIERLKPVAMGDTSGLDIDYPGLSKESHNALSILIITAERACGMVLNEIHDRDHDPDYRQKIDGKYGALGDELNRKTMAGESALIWELGATSNSRAGARNQGDLHG